MRSILINYYYDNEGHFIMPGYIEVDQYGVYPVDNKEDNKDSIYHVVKYFISNYSEYITQKAEDELNQKLETAYENLEEKEFYKVVEEIFAYFAKVKDEEVEFKIVNDEKIATRITVIRDSYHEVGYFIDRLGEDKSNVLRSMNENIRLKGSSTNKYNYEVERMLEFYSKNVSDYKNYNLGLIDYKQSTNSMLIRDKLRFNKKKIIALGMASLVLIGGIGYVKSNKNINTNSKSTKEIVTEVPTKALVNKTYEEETVKPVVTTAPTIEPTIEPTLEPTIEPLHYEEASDSIDTVAYSYENGSLIPHSINDAAYSDVVNMIYINNDIIYDLSNYILDPTNYEINKTGFIINFERYFANCSMFEQKYIKHFSDYLKDMIYQCYVVGNFEEAMRINKIAVGDVIKYIINDEPLSIEMEGERFASSYSELSDDVKDVLESLAWNFCTFLGRESVVYNDELYTNSTISAGLFTINSNVLTK